jgi:cobalt/nickel transport protein
MKFKVRSLEFGVWSILIFILLLTVHLSLSTASEKWPGVDESVIEKVAKEHGREAREPFINTDQGDLLLFVFLLAGTVGGFIGGYYWRALTEKGVDRVEILKKDI